MAFFPRPKNPLAAVRDFIAFLRQQERHTYVFAVLALMMPCLIITGFYFDAKMPPRPPQLIFVQSWPADRPDDVIKAEQKIDSEKRRKEAKERQEAYKRLADRLGIE